MKKARIVLASIALVEIFGGGALALKSKALAAPVIYYATTSGGHATEALESYTLAFISLAPTTTGYFTTVEDDVVTTTSVAYYTTNF